MFGHGHVFVPAYAEIIEVDDLGNLGPPLLSPCWSEREPEGLPVELVPLSPRRHRSNWTRSHFATLHLGIVAAIDAGVTQQWWASTSAVVNVLEVLFKISIRTFAATLCCETD